MISQFIIWPRLDRPLTEVVCEFLIEILIIINLCNLPFKIANYFQQEMSLNKIIFTFTDGSLLTSNGKSTLVRGTRFTIALQ